MEYVQALCSCGGEVVSRLETTRIFGFVVGSRVACFCSLCSKEQTTLSRIWGALTEDRPRDQRPLSGM